jgi:hypothetical protein
MTIQRDLELRLRTHFEDRADRSVVDGQLASILGRTARAGQRPGWLAAMRSPSMSDITYLTPARSRPAMIFVAIALLLVIFVAAFIAAGGPRLLGSPPTNGRIVFGRFDPALGDTVVYTVNPDGSHVVKVRPETYEGPFWSPDGKKLGLGHSVANPDGTGLVAFDQSGNTFHVECWDWSPDGARMLCEGFSDDATANATIHGVYSVRASDGKDLVRISAPGDQGVPGHYSPDGKQVAYFGTFLGVPNSLIVANVDGTDRHRVGRLTYQWAVNWAPDGQSLLAQNELEGRLYRIDLATGTETRVVIKDAPQDHIFEGQYSPDGTRILIRRLVAPGTSPDNQNVDLYTMRPDGTDLVLVVSDPEDDRFIDWGTAPLQ